MPKFESEIVEYDNLDSKTQKLLGVVRGVEFTEIEVKTVLKKGVLGSTGGEQALKYSAFYRSKKGYVFMLGWDHAILLRRGSEGFYVDSIYAHGENDANPDVRVYKVRFVEDEDLSEIGSTTTTTVDEVPSSVKGKEPATSSSRKGKEEATSSTVMEEFPPFAEPERVAFGDPVSEIETPKHHCGGHTGGECKWRKYDLSEHHIKIVKLVTFSITSCSFACLWPDDGSFLAVSHIAFKPPIPVFWMIHEDTPRTRRRSSSATRHSETVVAKTVPHLNLLASINASDQEQTKFTQPQLPYADEYDVTARLISRGPAKCSALGDNAPYMTHPYLSLRFPPVSDLVLYEGALGYNNDPEIPVELPPFHAIMGAAYTSFMACADATQILADADRLLKDEFGFGLLHNMMVGNIMGTDAKSMKAYTSYKSKKVDALMKQIKGSKTIPAMLRGREKAVFILAELTTNPKNPEYKLGFDAVMRAWAFVQMGFSFPLDFFHPGTLNIG